jgi:hypothetical protein
MLAHVVAEGGEYAVFGCILVGLLHNGLCLSTFVMSVTQLHDTRIQRSSVDRKKDRQADGDFPL